LGRKVGRSALGFRRDDQGGKLCLGFFLHSPPSFDLSLRMCDLSAQIVLLLAPLGAPLVFPLKPSALLLETLEVISTRQAGQGFLELARDRRLFSDEPTRWRSAVEERYLERVFWHGLTVFIGPPDFVARLSRLDTTTL
jgi:hypothetical protein